MDQLENNLHFRVLSFNNIPVHLISLNIFQVFLSGTDVRAGVESSLGSG